MITAFHDRKQRWLLICGLVVSLAAAGIFTSRALAYTGPFCVQYLSVGQECTSVQRTDIQRANGQGKDWTLVGISGTYGGQNYDQFAECKSDGCSAQTPSLPHAVTGYGSLQNIGDPCDCGGGDYQGFLNP